MQATSTQTTSNQAASMSAVAAMRVAEVVGGCVIMERMVGEDRGGVNKVV